ncbi:hypothetical protein [Methylibium sp.]|uniref:hypothetical protein n=1 Tax=Methylibium sp. TaxID=2067992 RepID=UPI003D0E6DC3
MSSTPPPPVKTSLGHEELRQRTRRFSQRHRTVLLLVDGKRRHDEVLALAQQAGVAPNFFDELLAAGLIELGVPAMEFAELAMAAEAPVELTMAAAPPAEASDADTADLDEAVIEAMLLVVDAPAAEAIEAQGSDEGPGSLEDAMPEPSFENSVPIPLVLPAASTEALPVRPARVKFAAPLYQPPLRTPLPARPMSLRPESRQPTPGLAPIGHRVEERSPLAQDSAGDDEPLLAEVRSLLIGTLLVDGPVSSSLNVLRVGRARDRHELIGLVWQIERALVEARRPREALGRLRRARELLGLGNTMVDEDTKPGSSTH